MNKGTLYGVSVGPGDPELMTVKAVKVLERCRCVAAPQTGGEKTLALDIARGAVDFSGKELLSLPFLMTRDQEAMHQNHLDQAAVIAEKLDGGTDVAMLNLGDVSVFSTFSYLMDILTEQGYAVEMIPGVPSFCAVAAALHTGLTSMNKPLHIIPAGGMELDEALDMLGTKVLMKTGKSMPEVRRALKLHGLADKTMLVQNCGLPTERVCRSLDDASDDISYFTTILVGE